MSPPPQLPPPKLPLPLSLLLKLEELSLLLKLVELSLLTLAALLLFSVAVQSAAAVAGLLRMLPPFTLYLLAGFARLFPTG